MIKHNNYHWDWCALLWAGRSEGLGATAMILSEFRQVLQEALIE